MIASVDALRACGASVIGVLCVIDRSDGSNAVLGFGLVLRSWLTRNDHGPADDWPRSAS